MNRNASRWITCPLFLLALASCSGESTSAISDTVGTSDAACTSSDTCGLCTVTVQTANVWGSQGCPGTFDGTNVGLPCNAPHEWRASGTCGGLRVLWRGHGTHSALCFYQPDSGVLVAVRSTDDVKSYCAHTSSAIQGGPIPVDCDVAHLAGSATPCTN